jgi:glycolate oxidase iron-sulfur subunit
MTGATAGGCSKSGIEYAKFSRDPNLLDSQTRPDESGPGRPDRRPAPRHSIAALADQCVKCGLCLPHCPTYRLAGLESESPRGRIAILQGLDARRFEASSTTRRHLDNCVGCRTCESVCPAQVRYGELFDAGRRLLPAGSPPLLGWISRHAHATRFLLRCLRVARRLGLHRLGPRDTSARPAWLWRGLRRLPLPAPSRRLKERYEPEGRARGDVYLFRGCVTQSMDTRSLVATARVLANLGYRVRVPATQGCCGALDQHDGRRAQATRLADRNAAAFGAGDAPILTTASGCAATLLDYGGLTSDGDAGVAARTQDICVFLLRHLDEFRERLRPQTARVALHLPCTARNVTASAEASRALLEKLPGIEVRVLDTALGCCGAAGHHFLSRPDQADALLAPVLDDIGRLEPDFVATTNIGCALHLGGGMAGRAGSAPVIHPIVLIARGLGLAG